MNASESSAPSPRVGEFIFVTCQVGAEPALKAELARNRPELRLAFSRRGFLTFKAADGQAFADDFFLGATFAREFGLGLGEIQAATLEERVAKTWALAKDLSAARLHVFPRCRVKPGRSFTPGLTEESEQARAALEAARPGGPQPVADAPLKNRQQVLDVVLLEPDRWWVGRHRHTPEHVPAPGGFGPVDPPPHVVSRAYWKLLQSLAWSRLPMEPDQLCCELGSSPGGAAQALLERGMRVMGVDPAEMAPIVLENPNFIHVRRRTPAVRRKEFRKVKWLLADMNVAPTYTLDAAEAIVMHDESDVRGLLLTLKLPEWKLADEIPAFIERIESWGFEGVRARQLQHHRQEIVVTGRRGRRR